jgi:hypothetical protein
VASVESNAPAVVYLLSDAASGVNGRVIFTGGERMTYLVKARPASPSAKRAEWSVAAVAEVIENEWGFRPAREVLEQRDV